LRKKPGGCRLAAGTTNLYFGEAVLKAFYRFRRQNKIFLSAYFVHFASQNEQNKRLKKYFLAASAAKGLFRQPLQNFFSLLKPAEYFSRNPAAVSLRPVRPTFNAQTRLPP
jgi:hypothetical protein